MQKINIKYAQKTTFIFANKFKKNVKEYIRSKKKDTYGERSRN